MPDAPTGTAGGAPAAFPSTIWSEVFALQETDPDGRRERLQRLIERYWRPVYWAMRCDKRFSEEEVRDLTQEFFVLILEGQIIPGVDPRLGSFRRYLKGALRNFQHRQWEKENTLKRGGGRKVVALDFEFVGVPPEATATDPETALDRAWALQILDEALRRLETELTAEGRQWELQAFREYDLATSGTPLTYRELGERFGKSEGDVLSGLRFCRRRLREIVLENISPYVRNEAELLDELGELFGG